MGLPPHTAPLGMEEVGPAQACAVKVVVHENERTYLVLGGLVILCMDEDPERPIKEGKAGLILLLPY